MLENRPSNRQRCELEMHQCPVDTTRLTNTNFDFFGEN